jgi:O-antigen/teichoic acid export membrane protein
VDLDSQYPFGRNLVTVHKKDKLGLSLFLSLVISYFGLAASFLSAVLVARALGPGGKGQFSLFQATVAGLVAFSSLGLGHGQMYYSSRNPEKMKHFMANGYVFSTLIGGVVAILYFLIGQIWSPKIIAVLGWQIAILVIVVAPVSIMLGYQRQYFLANHAYEMSKINLALGQVIPLVGYTVLYVMGNVTISNVILMFVGSQFLCLALFHILIARSTPVKSSFSLSFGKQSMSFGIRQYLSDLTQYFALRLDFFLVVWLLGESGLGIYSVAVSLAEITSRFSSEVGSILFPAFASGQIPPGQAAPILRRTLFLAALVALLLSLVGHLVTVLIFGSRFEQAIPAFRWLLCGTVAWGIIHVTWNRISAAGKPEMGIPIFAATALFDAAAIIILVPKFGVVGASMAAAGSYWLTAFLFLMIFCKREKCTMREALVVQWADLLSFVRSVTGVRKLFRPA